MYQRFCDHPVNVKVPSDGKFRSSSVVDGSYLIVIGQHIRHSKWRTILTATIMLAVLNKFPQVSWKLNYYNIATK